MTVTTLTDETFETALPAAEVAIVILSDPACETCTPYMATVEKVADRLQDVAEFFTVTHQSAPQVFATSGVTAVPTTVVFREGMLLHLDSGTHTEANLEKLVHLFAEADIEEMRTAVEEQGTTVIGQERD
ncbi:thioredoxin family protein [Kytococcus sp. Marseille-QA3725]